MQTKFCRSYSHHIKGWTGLVYWDVSNPLLKKGASFVRILILLHPNIDSAALSIKA
jgi:hypothetical protein